VTDERDDLAATRRRIHQQMGGMEKVRALRLAGRRTARDFISAFFDADSFVELGTFAGMHAGAPPTVAGDGRVTGQATLDGLPVGVIVDDVTVKRASSTVLNARKAERVVHMAKRAGMPVLFVGEAGGARLPDTMKGDVFASEPIYPWLFDPERPPLISAIVGESYGGSSFVAAMSDITVMTKGSVIALTSPRVITMATGERVTPEELGGAEVLASKTDLIDIVVNDTAELDDVLRRVLEFFTRPLVEDPQRPDRDLRELVPRDDSKVYDIRAVVDAIVDGESFLELGARRGRSIVTGLGRIDGRVVGIVASQPLHEAGALSPAACEKTMRMTGLCERFGFPIVCLVDTPGFQIGVQVEHAGMLRRTMDVVRANTAATFPVVTVILRKAFGLAFFAMFSPDHGGDVVLAWPGAHIGFMDPVTAANVLYGDEFANATPAQRREALAERAKELGASATALDVAAAMGIDEIVDEADTATAIRRYLDTLAPIENLRSPRQEGKHR
jgi:acetyl-CoA carboxylase carboxyltransferase component